MAERTVEGFEGRGLLTGQYRTIERNTDSTKFIFNPITGEAVVAPNTDNLIRTTSVNGNQIPEVIRDIINTTKPVNTTGVGIIRTAQDIEELSRIAASSSGSTKVKDTGDLNIDPVEDTTPELMLPSNAEANALQDANAEEFRIKYSGVDGSTKYFAFSLLPAIESTLRGNNHGQTVPEVKPGILVRTKMNYKKFNVPGGHSVYQSLGVDQTILQLTGLFIGVEGEETSFPADALLYGDNAGFGRANPEYSNVDAGRSARLFMDNVVHSGSPIEILIKSRATSSLSNNEFINLEYKCLIQDFRSFFTRHDRTYYSIDALVISTKNKRLNSSILSGAKREEITNAISNGGAGASTKITNDFKTPEGALNLNAIKTSVESGSITPAQAAELVKFEDEDGQITKQDIYGVIDFLIANPDKAQRTVGGN